MQHDTVEVAGHAGVELVAVDVDGVRGYGAGEAKVSPGANLLSAWACAAEDGLGLGHGEALDRVGCVGEDLEGKGFVRCSERTRADLDAEWFVAEAAFEAIDFCAISFPSDESDVGDTGRDAGHGGLGAGKIGGEGDAGLELLEAGLPALHQLRNVVVAIDADRAGDLLLRLVGLKV